MNRLRDDDALTLTTDVLIVGGGPAATWAALAARERGARVILVDKGYCGSSGVGAAATIGHWWVEPSDRDGAMAERNAAGGNLSEFDWMSRTLDETWRHWPEVAVEKGYPAGGATRGIVGSQRLVQGPVYLREMRRRVLRAGVTILDHSPALELLIDNEGAVRGGAGIQRQAGRRWKIRAGAVVLAVGGCAFKSGCLGGNTDTGDGYLMAAEVGAALSGMEFCNYYGLVPVGGSVDKNGYYLFATYYNAVGREIDIGWSPPAGVMGTKLPSALLEGPVFAQFSQVRPEQRIELRAGQPNLFTQFDRLGIDPFRQRFQVEPIMEGSVRGTGGVAIADETCWSGIPGLWVAGDTASRERITGAASGAGSPNAAWTIASGRWSGQAAADHALSVGPVTCPLLPAGGAGLRPVGRADERPGLWRTLTSAMQAEVLPLDKNGLRSETTMRRSLDRLGELWSFARSDLSGSEPREMLWARETAAMLAVARWAYTSALARPESRIMHVRLDHQDEDPTQRHRIIAAGIDEIVLRRLPIGTLGGAQIASRALHRRSASMASTIG